MGELTSSVSQEFGIRHIAKVDSGVSRRDLDLEGSPQPALSHMWTELLASSQLIFIDCITEVYLLLLLCKPSVASANSSP